ncbi:MAG TPA: large conductance mechanosensitive channel protein MscL [Candidatus Erysipelatoclostridium merdavium]|uniref:Large-conductance mechanosensitive channel n=1 Tax=Candidatus Erysipelatoclostridium merdavium TaxID=2838566 RepID=A0A9D2BMZ3_9FIRM|nr:large conductance mechanosensitive channel protein MscL [Candidatus Erysipelatoclostridium merdavium]
MMKRGKNLIEEFKKFITRGNVIDMAVGVIIGGSFTTIVTSLNNDIITPILGIFGGVDFSNLKLVLGSDKNAPVLAYGSFITAVINFLIVAFILFALIKLVNSINESIKAKIGEENKAEAKVKICPFCKEEINIEASRCPHCTSVIDE